MDRMKPDRLLRITAIHDCAEYQTNEHFSAVDELIAEIRALRKELEAAKHNLAVRETELLAAAKENATLRDRVRELENEICPYCGGHGV